MRQVRCGFLILRNMQKEMIFADVCEIYNARGVEELKAPTLARIFFGEIYVDFLRLS